MVLREEVEKDFLPDAAWHPFVREGGVSFAGISGTHARLQIEFDVATIGELL